MAEDQAPQERVLFDPEEISWEEPEDIGGQQQSNWAPIAEELKKRPRQWAKVAVYPDERTAYSGAGNIRRGKIKAMPKGDFEAKARKVVGTGYVVYARYVGAPPQMNIVTEE